MKANDTGFAPQPGQVLKKHRPQVLEQELPVRGPHREDHRRVRLPAQLRHGPEARKHHGVPGTSAQLRLGPGQPGADPTPSQFTNTYSADVLVDCCV
jgi:hypothetical protein